MLYNIQHIIWSKRKFKQSFRILFDLSYLNSCTFDETGFIKLGISFFYWEILITKCHIKEQIYRKRTKNFQEKKRKWSCSSRQIKKKRVLITKIVRTRSDNQIFSLFEGKFSFSQISLLCLLLKFLRCEKKTL
jgi:hypothetical protein